MAQEKESLFVEQQNLLGEKGMGGWVGRNFFFVAPSRPSL
jgi:hypothetical protein